MSANWFVVFTAQMDQFYTQGDGADLFVTDHAVETAHELTQEVENWQRRIEFWWLPKKSQAFVAQCRGRQLPI